MGSESGPDDYAALDQKPALHVPEDGEVVAWDTMDVYNTLEIGQSSSRSIPPTLRANPVSFLLHRTLTDHTWFFLLILSILSAATATGIDIAIEALLDGQQKISQSPYGALNYVLYVVFGLVFSLISVGVSSFSTHATGSGIPAIKSILGGVWMGPYLGWRCLAVKVVGLVTAIAGGLSVGKEGPYVHINCMIAHLLAKLGLFAHVHDNFAKHLQVLGAAAGAGVATAFGAPVGGVLFSIEVTATYFMTEHIWKGLFVSVCACFFVQLFGPRGVTELFVTEFDSAPWQKAELVAFVAMGVISGLVGAAFVWLYMQLCHYKKQFAAKFPVVLGNPFFQVLAVSFVAATLTWPFESLQGKPVHTVSIFFEETDIDAWERPNLYTNLLIYFVMKFFVTMLSISLPLPVGLYTPVFTAGACMGRLIGEVVKAAAPSLGVIPGGYAVVGAAGLSAGVTRTVSTAVIVFELTGQLHHLLPTLMTVLVATFIGDLLTPSIYDVMLTMKGLPFVKRFRIDKFYDHKVKDVMRTDLTVLTRSSTYREVEDCLKVHEYTMFPLVTDKESMVFIGVVPRQYLVDMLDELASVVKSEVKRPPRNSGPRGSPKRRQSNNSDEEDLEPILMDSPEPVAPSSDSDLVEVDDTGDAPTSPQGGFSGPSLGSFLSSAHMHEGDPSDRPIPSLSVVSPQVVITSQILIPETMSLGKLHFCFQMLGLSMSFVSGIGGVLKGVVTKKDLMRIV